VLEIKKKFEKEGLSADIAMILGSGLSNLADDCLTNRKVNFLTITFV